MFRKKKRSFLFYKYLISYLIIFLIPFITISIIFYQMSVNTLRDEIIQSHTQELEQVKDLSDTRMNELGNIASQISMDYRLTPYMLSKPYNAKKGVEELVKYKINNSLIDGIYLHYYDHDQIYSSRGTSSIDTFLTNSYSVKKSVHQAFKEKMKGVSKPEIYPIKLSDASNNHVMAYLYPIPPINSVPYGTAIFFIKEKSIEKLIRTTLGNTKGNTYVYNDQNVLLASSNRGKLLKQKDIQVLANNKNGITKRTFNEQNYSIITNRSDDTKWTYVTAIPTDQFYGKMNDLKITIISTLAIIALFGVGIAIIMAFKQYKPIQNLSRSLTTNQSELADHKDELINIQETIDRVYKERQQLHKKMEIQEPYLRDQLLLQLLKGKATIHDEAKSLLTELQITFNRNHFFAVVISFNDKIADPETLEGRERLLREFSNLNCVGYGVELIQDNAVVLIVNIAGELNAFASERRSFVKQLVTQLQYYGLPTRIIGVGNIHEGAEHLNRSFIEANAAIEYALINNADQSIFFEDISGEESSFWFPLDEQVKFEQSLKQGDQIVAKETLAAIISDMKDKAISIHVLKAMCYDIINIVLKNMSGLGIEDGEDDIKSLIEFRSLDDLQRNMSVFINMICEQVETRKESHNVELRDSVLDYIQNQYKSHELSLELTAEIFQLSPSYLSRFMKEQTGFTFTQYVWELRNNEFKRKLVETTAPIKEIVSEIGYLDVANFTRKFKKAEGLTPGQYRKLGYDKSSQNIV